MIRLEPETCDCGKKMELAWITYDEGKPEKAAWKCVSCKKIRKDFIHSAVRPLPSGMGI